VSGLSLLIVVLCTLAACGLSSLYLALSTVARSAVEELARNSNNKRRQKRIARIFDDVASHARSVGLLKLVCCAGVVLGLMFKSADLRRENQPNEWDALIALGGGVVILWIFAVLIPFGVASYAGPRVLYGWSRILRAADMVLFPLRPLGVLTDKLMLKMAGTTGKDEQEVAQDEILSVVQENVTAGAIDEHEQKMIEAVVTFGDLTVQQVMTPRTEIEAMELTSDLGEVIRTVRSIGHSRIPVYEGSLDQIVGMFYVKDLMHWLAGEGPMGRAAAAAGAAAGGPPVPAKHKGFDLRDILRPALSVPETKTISELLRQLMEQKVHIAVAVDEHGNTAGVVTFEDIVEQIVGDIRDEYESTNPDVPDVVISTKTGTAEINAAARVSDVNNQLEKLGIGVRVMLTGLKSVQGSAMAGSGTSAAAQRAMGGTAVAMAVPPVEVSVNPMDSQAPIPTAIQLPESEDYETVGGLIITHLGHIPAKGEKVRLGRCELEVSEAAPTRVLKVRLRIL
jgi:putative hemolysin